MGRQFVPEAQGSPGIIAGHGDKEAKGVFSISSHGAVDEQLLVVNIKARHAGDAGNPPLARAKTDDVVVASGVSQRTHHIGAVGNGQHLQGQADGRTAAASAGGQFRIVSVSGGTVYIVVGLGPKSEFPGHWFCRWKMAPRDRIRAM